MFLGEHIKSHDFPFTYMLNWWHQLYFCPRTFYPMSYLPTDCPVFLLEYFEFVVINSMDARLRFPPYSETVAFLYCNKVPIHKFEQALKTRPYFHSCLFFAVFNILQIMSSLFLYNIAKMPIQQKLWICKSLFLASDHMEFFFLKSYSGFVSALGPSKSNFLSSLTFLLTCSSLCSSIQYPSL